MHRPSLWRVVELLPPELLLPVLMPVRRLADAITHLRVQLRVLSLCGVACVGATVAVPISSVSSRPISRPPGVLLDSTVVQGIAAATVAASSRRSAVAVASSIVLTTTAA